MKINHRAFEIKLLKIVFSITLILCLAQGHLCAETPTPTNWEKIHTENTIIYFQSRDDLKKFSTRINYGTIDQKAVSSMIDTLPQRIDAVFKKSQEILEMRGFTNKINIKLFKNKHQLRHAFYDLYKKECNARAWYSHETLTVFVQLGDLHEGVLAHEFAHAIIDHYMIIPPPRKSAEILARYVDTHLHGENTQHYKNLHAEGYSVK